MVNDPWNDGFLYCTAGADPRSRLFWFLSPSCTKLVKGNFSL